MTNTKCAGILVAVLAAGLAGCDSLPTQPKGDEGPVITVLPPTPAFVVADVTVSGVVYEDTANGRVPIAGVLIANGEGWSGLTDADGFFSFKPVWVCPCPVQPMVPAGTTSLWVGKEGYTDPEGLPVSRFGPPYDSPGYRDVAIDGDMRVEFRLVKR
jgi:hypothetical protein